MRVNYVWYFVSTHKTRRMKSIEIFLRRGEERRGRMMEGVDPRKIYCKHISKYHKYYYMLIEF
jgi:hypothetical protein